MARKVVIASLWLASLVGVGAVASAMGAQSPQPSSQRFTPVSREGPFTVFKDVKFGECYIVYSDTQSTSITHTTPQTCN
jgi:hypothetical protein